MRTPDDGPIGVMMRELGLWLDLGALFSDPVFYGMHVPRGDGKLVVIIPGFLGSDFYLMPMLNWLRRIGYNPVRSTLSLSAGCLQRSCDQVKAQIERHLRREQQQVALIGHSRGEPWHGPSPLKCRNGCHTWSCWERAFLAFCGPSRTAHARSALAN